MKNRKVSRSKSNRNKTGIRLLYYLILAAIIVFGLVLAMLLYAGPNLSYDDIFYISSAHTLLQGNMSFILSKFSFGFLKTAVLALSFILFGYGPLQAVIPSIAYFVATVYLVFLIGKNMHGYGLGLLSAFLVATMPFFVENATRVLPDLPLGMVVALFFYLLFKYSHESRRSGRIVIALLAGFSASLPIYMKTEGFIIIFAEALSVLLLYLYRRRTKMPGGMAYAAINKKFLLCAFAGLAIGLLLYSLTFYIITGSPFFSIEHYGGAITPALVSKATAIMTLLNLDTFAKNPYSILSMSLTSLGLFPIVSALGTAIGIKKRDAGMMAMSLFLWFAFLYLFFGPASTASFIMIPTVTRFFDALAAPFAVLSGYCIISVYSMFNMSKTGRRNRRYAIGAAASCAVLALILITNVPLYQIDQVYATRIQSTYSFLENTSLELQTLSNGSGFTAYINASVGFRQVRYRDMRFLNTYNSSRQFFGTNSFDTDIVVSACPAVLPSKNAYLVEFTSVIDANISSNRSGQGGPISRWLGDNCTIRFEKSFVGYEDFSRNAASPAEESNIYRIMPKVESVKDP